MLPFVLADVLLSHNNTNLTSNITIIIYFLVKSVLSVKIVVIICKYCKTIELLVCE